MRGQIVCGHAHSRVLCGTRGTPLWPGTRPRSKTRSRVKTVNQLAEPVPFVAQQCLARHQQIVEEEFRGVLSVVAQFFLGFCPRRNPDRPVSTRNSDRLRDDRSRRSVFATSTTKSASWPFEMKTFLPL